MKYFLGVDIGGMSIKAGLVKDGCIIDRNSCKTKRTADECIAIAIHNQIKIFKVNTLWQRKRK